MTKLDYLTEAHRIAYRAGQDERFTRGTRELFRTIARLIWLAHGKAAAETEVSN